MKDSTRENLSYFGLYKRLLTVKKEIQAEKVSFGDHKDQYYLYFEPEKVTSDKVIIWVHGGGWQSGTPKDFYYVGQAIAKAGYRCVSLGYRLSTKFKYPCQIDDVCTGYNKAIEFLKGKGIDVSKVVVSGPSAGAHLTSILCYSKADQERYGVDVSNVIGFIGFGGPYCFEKCQDFAIRTLLNCLFTKEYNRKQAEPVSLMTRNSIPMLLIQSEHDGLLDFGNAEAFEKKAKELGNKCELYRVEDAKNTHSWYTAGCFFETREENKCIDKFFSYIENL
ncbi:MAG: alpha/beta hydrolase [Clostridiales bacterium]|nr:alpha/beta hydrolase [Clostridiales bacterium]